MLKGMEAEIWLPAVGPTHVLTVGNHSHDK